MSNQNQIKKSTREEVELKVKATLSQQDYEELKEIFELFDEDQSGFISQEEVHKTLEQIDRQSINPTLLKVIKSLEGLKGQIDLDSFIEAICDQLGNTKTKSGCQKLFELIDIQKKGKIELEDFKYLTNRLGENMNDDELNELIHNVHVLEKTKSNTQISAEEFYNIVTKNKKY